MNAAAPPGISVETREYQAWSSTPAGIVEPPSYPAAAHTISWTLINLAERVLAFILLIACLPILAIAAAIVAILSGQSPLVALARAGYRGKPIWLIKLRTMWGKPEVAHARRGLVERIEVSFVPPVKRSGDPRVTSSLAAFCRRHSIDELPQLWQVVSGDMALVGPRPITYAELDAYYRDSAAEVLSVKPGLTGLWQVSGRNSLDYAERRTLDLHLVRDRSPQLYLHVLAATFPAVFSGRNAG